MPVDRILARLRAPGAMLPLAVAIVAGLGPVASAGILYDFAWSGNSFSASGTLELDDTVGIGSPFTTGDVLAFELELFDGAAPVASLAFPPFDLPFDTIEGTRNESTLSITDLVVSDFGTLFGCTGGDCLSGVVFFATPSTPGAEVDFGSIEAARASFVFTELPEPDVSGSLGVALGALAGLRAARSRWSPARLNGPGVASSSSSGRAAATGRRSPPTRAGPAA
jgi:hypothetical protein